MNGRLARVKSLIRSIDVWVITLVIITIFYIILCFIYPPARHSPQAVPLPAIATNTTPPHPTSEFIPGTCLPTPFAYTPTEPAVYGSVANKKNLLGEYYSPWYVAQNNFHLWIAGYPAVPDNRLKVEVQTTTEPVQFTVKPQINPGYLFSDQSISLATIKNATAFRLVSTVGSPTGAGWMCVSQPFNWQSDRANEIREILRVVATFITSVVLLLLPGLLLRNLLSQSHRYSFPFILVPLPGITGLIGLSIAAWCLECATFGAFSSQSLMAVGIIPFLGYAIFYLRQHPLTRITSSIERRVLVISVLVALLAVAKGVYSPGPLGELYSGFISRTTEIGPLSDSRISYLYSQLISHGINPLSETGEGYFRPWHFSSRGPLAGLVSSPIVFLSGAFVPTTAPESPWTVFDPEGFSAYRIAMSVLAATSLIALFGLAAKLVGEKWGLLAVFLAATTPFIVHEMYFTWPKLAAAMFVLIAVYGLFERRFFFSGIAIAIGYLFHPSVLLSIPALLAVLSWKSLQFEQTSTAVSQDSSDRSKDVQGGKRRMFFVGDRVYFFAFLRRITRTSAQFFCGIALIALIWWLINGFNIQQGRFLEYFQWADGSFDPTIQEWIISRITSLKIFFIPLYLLTQNTVGVRYLMETVYQTILPAVIPFFLQYWNTLPFGMGITFFPWLTLIFVLGLLKFRYIFVFIIVVPFLIFWLWWGPTNAGMLLGGLHTWIFAVILLSVMVAKQYFFRQRVIWELFIFFLLLRGSEVFALLCIPIWLSIHRVINDKFLVNDSAMLLTMGSVTCYLVLQTYQYARALRLEQSSRSAQV